MPNSQPDEINCMSDAVGFDWVYFFMNHNHLLARASLTSHQLIRCHLVGEQPDSQRENDQRENASVTPPMTRRSRAFSDSDLIGGMKYSEGLGAHCTNFSPIDAKTLNKARAARKKNRRPYTPMAGIAFSEPAVLRRKDNSRKKGVFAWLKRIDLTVNHAWWNTGCLSYSLLYFVGLPSIFLGLPLFIFNSDLAHYLIKSDLSKFASVIVLDIMALVSWICGFAFFLAYEQYFPKVTDAQSAVSNVEKYREVVVLLNTTFSSFTVGLTYFLLLILLIDILKNASPIGVDAYIMLLISFVFIVQNRYRAISELFCQTTSSAEIQSSTLSKWTKADLCVSGILSLALLGIGANLMYKVHQKTGWELGLPTAWFLLCGVLALYQIFKSLRAFCPADPRREPLLPVYGSFDFHYRGTAEESTTAAYELGGVARTRP